MEKEFGCANPKIISYTENTFHPEDEILKEVRERSIKEGLPPIQLGKMDARHLEVLTRACAAKKAVEIGTLGGYSGIAILRGMEEGARLWTFELKSKNAQVARESFQKAGFKESSEVIEGRAIENLSSIESHGPFDLVFMDADKQGYPDYLDWAEKNLKVGGLVIGDNTFGFGKIADDNPSKEVQALQKFNQKLAQSDKFKATILPTGEGLTVAVKVS